MVELIVHTCPIAAQPFHRDDSESPQLLAFIEKTT